MNAPLDAVVEPPSALHVRAARFCAVIAATLLDQSAVPNVKWARQPGAFGYMRPIQVMAASGTIPADGTIYLSPSLPMNELPETVAHETFHLTYHRHWPRGAERFQEHQAIEFGEKWGDTLGRAGSCAGWDPARVRIIHENDPGQLDAWQVEGTSVGTVAISRSSLRDTPAAWRYDGKDWTEL